MTKFTCQFVEFIPDLLEENVLYISMRYTTVTHKCPCGCGVEVVTPLSPVEWNLTYDGEVVSLFPSIGNWSLPCRSHYWIKNSSVVWSTDWTPEKIRAGREAELEERKAYIDIQPKDVATDQEESTENWISRAVGNLKSFLNKRKR